MRATPMLLIAVSIATFGTYAGVLAQTSATKPEAKKSAPKTASVAQTTLPPAIETAFKKAYPTATIKHVSKEKEGGQTVF